MAHRLQDRIVELNGSWNQKSRVLRLRRHGCRLRLERREERSGVQGGGRLREGVSFGAKRGVDLENRSLLQMPRDQRQSLPRRTWGCQG